MSLLFGRLTYQHCNNDLHWFRLHTIEQLYHCSERSTPWQITFYK